MSIDKFEPSTPLVLALAGEPDRLAYEEAVHLAGQITESYDAKSQTATIPAYAGTNATVCYRGTGTVISPDSAYPNDDP